MKKTYQKPSSSSINLQLEDSILIQTSSTSVDTSSDDFEQRSDEMDENYDNEEW